MSWVTRHSEAIQATTAMVTASMAVLAVAGVLLQMRAAERTSRAQTAREAYATHLTTAVANPDFAYPPDACALIASPKGPAYQAFVDHLLYSAELMLADAAGWEETFFEALIPHAVLICGDRAGDDTASITLILKDFRAQICPATPDCAAGG
jgi:hypothetical protein